MHTKMIEKIMLGEKVTIEARSSDDKKIGKLMGDLRGLNPRISANCTTTVERDNSQHLIAHLRLLEKNVERQGGIQEALWEALEQSKSILTLPSQKPEPL